MHACPTLPSQTTDFPGWYAELVRRAELAEHSAVRGSMVIRPYGFAIWELLQRQLDDRIKATGHENVYFPLLVPMSVLAKEADLVEGFSPQVAVVTEAAGAQLEEPLVIRPTSEATIWNTYARWIHSHRDLPLLYNQWANVVRWELRPTAVPAHHRVPLAGGPHRPRDGRAGDRRVPHHPSRGVRRLPAAGAGDAGAARPKEPPRALPRRR